MKTTHRWPTNRLTFSVAHRLILLATFFLVACAGGPAIESGSAAVSTPDTPAVKNSASSSALNQSNGIIAALDRPDLGYSFEWNAEQWDVLNDPTDRRLNAFQFYNSNESMQAEIRLIRHSLGEIPDVAEKMQLDKSGFVSGADTVISQSEYTGQHSGIQGMFWQAAVEKEGVKRQAMGFVFFSGRNYYLLNLTERDKVSSLTHLKTKWTTLFDGFKLLSKQQEQIDEPKQSWDTHRKTFQSQEFGYRFEYSEDYWYDWQHGLFASASPDMALISRDESAKVLVLANGFQESLIRGSELFSVYMARLGIDTESEDFRLQQRERDGVLQYTFSGSSVKEEFGTVHQGWFRWDGTRGFLVSLGSSAEQWKQNQQMFLRTLQSFQWQKDFGLKALTEEQRSFNAQILNQLGLMRLYEKKSLTALTYFEKANREDPDEPLYLINCGFVYQQQELYGPGIQHFMSQLDLVRQHGKLLAILGEMHEAVREYALARNYYEMALQFSPYDQELVINLSDALWGVGQKNLSLEVVEDLFARQPSRRLGIYVAKTQMGLERYSEAVDFLQALKARFGLNKDLGLTLTDALLYLGRYQETLSTTAELIKLAEDDPRAWITQGKSQYYLKQFRMAEQSLERAMRLEPVNDEARSYLSAVRSFLGKADVKALQKPIKPVFETPADLRTWYDQELAKKYEDENFAAIFHHKEKQLRSMPPSPWVKTEALFIELRDKRAISLFQEFVWSFLPNYDRLYVNKLEIYDSSFRKKASGNMKNWYITSLQQDGSSGDAKLAHITVPPAQPGDFILIQVSYTPIKNSGTMPFTHHTASEAFPVGQDRFVLITDTSKVRWEAYGELVEKAVPGGIAWSVTDPVIVRNELYMPTYRDFGSGVLVSRDQTWSSVGAAYEDLIRHRYSNALPIRERTWDIRGSRKVDEQVIYDVANWVRKEIQYRNIPFGGHSLIPSQSLKTYQARFGDCKDQSLLLMEMLQALGVPARLALIHLEDPVFEGIASIQQFNHMIVFVPAGENWPAMYIDPSEDNDSFRPVPLSLEDKTALIIDSTQSRIAALPILEKEQEHQALVFHDILLKENGEAQFRDSLSLSGKFAAAFRSQLLGKDAKQRRELAQNWLEFTFPKAILITVRFENIGDFNKKLNIILHFSSDDYFARNESGITGQIPNVWEREFMKLPFVRKRHHPIRIPHEHSFVSRTNIRYPKQWSFQWPEQSHEPSQYIEIATDKENNPGDAQLNVAWKTFAIYADPSEYDAIRAEWDYVLQETGPKAEWIIP